jgi:hypothetical protein
MSAQGDRRDEGELLAELVALEQRLEAVYADLAAGGDGEAARTAAQFREHCREHVRGLATALDNRGGSRGLESPGDSPEPGLAAALELETAATAAYYRAHAGFGDDPLLPTLTSVMANHGQHLVVLRQGLGQEPATLAFETGGVE